MTCDAVSYHQCPVSEWVEKNLPGSLIKDKRLSSRLKVIGEHMALEPGQTIPKMFPYVSPMESAYNFMGNDKTSPELIQHDHKWETCELVKRITNETLYIQDTSAMSHTQRGPIEGLGPIGPAGEGQGFFIHTTLAVEMTSGGEGLKPGGHKLAGIANQQYMVRPPEVKGHAGKGLDRSKEGDGEDFESQKWVRGIEGAEPGEGPAPIVVCDREGDTWELMNGCAERELGFCIRAARDRVLVSPDGPPKLMGNIRSRPSLGSVPLELRARPGKKARTATMNLSVSRATLRAPQRPGRAAGTAPPMDVNVVRVWEEDGGDLEWILLVSGAADNLEHALQWARRYSVRWLIEEYHKALKTGMGAEALQLETGKRLMTAVSIMAIVALRLLAMRETARIAGDSPAEEAGLTPEELKVLRASVPRRKTVENIRDVVKAIGRLDGHLGRKRDGLPGWITLWRGYNELRLLTKGYMLAQSEISEKR